MATLPKNYEDITARVIELLDKNPGQAVKELAQQLKVNRTFLAGYLKAMEAQGSVRSKEIGPARVYFMNDLGGGSR
jgi:predicted transcriptional regulator